jgi:DNA polymerase III epsilon subunit-like protein
MNFFSAIGKRRSMALTTPSYSSSPRLIAIDFETVGFRERDGPDPLPWENFPVSVAMYSVSDEGEVESLFVSLVSGAEQFTDWATRHHPFSPDDLRDQPRFSEVVARMSALVRPSDVLVSHNTVFDIEKVLRVSCEKTGTDGSALLSLPTYCTCRGDWAMAKNGNRWLSFAGLCAIVGVPQTRAHTAAGDAGVLAKCMSKALKASEGHSLGLGDELRAALSGQRGNDR